MSTHEPVSNVKYFRNIISTQNLIAEKKSSQHVYSILPVDVILLTLIHIVSMVLRQLVVFEYEHYGKAFLTITVDSYFLFIRSLHSSYVS